MPFLPARLSHVNPAAQQRLTALEPDETLYVTLELMNPRDGVAVQIQTEDYHMIGWAPRYLVRDLATAIAEAPSRYSARVVRMNRPEAALPYPVLSTQRVLIEMRGKWERHESMTDENYQLVPADG